MTYSYLGIEIDLSDVEDLQELENAPEPQPFYKADEVNRQIAAQPKESISDIDWDELYDIYGVSDEEYIDSELELELEWDGDENFDDEIVDK